MNHYNFPIIETIDDVLPHIDGREEFRVLNKDWYTVIRYLVNLENTFNWDENDSVGSAIRRECRGLIFDREGKLISRPFHKFFNCNEREETQLSQVNLCEPHVIQMKLDGSMIRPIPTNQGFRLGTKSGITDTSMNAETFIADKPNYTKLIQYCINKNSTPIFEWASRQNRIVIDYPEDNLILTAIRSNKTGYYVPYSVLQTLGQDFKLPVVNAVSGLSIKNVEHLAKQVQEWEGSEGIVIRFDTGHMVKIKSDDYVLKHRSKDAIHQEKNVLQVILNNGVDDLIALLTPEDADRLYKFQTAFWKQVEETAYQMGVMFNEANVKYSSDKEFAINFAQKISDPYVRAIMYGIKKGNGSFSLIKEIIMKNLISQTKVDNVRHLFGGISWNF